MKRIILLGATGSIGRSACDVVRTHPDEFRVVALAVRDSLAAASVLGGEFGARVYSGEDGAIRAVEENEADIVLVATVGLSGLRPTLAAIRKGMAVALATKEVMVTAGAIVTRAAEERGTDIIPVDSEHSAIFQCLQGGVGIDCVSRLILTASGGPFIDGPADLDAVAPEQALNHPRWKMGPKVTIDSAGMMNKGFEVVEARWLFSIPPDRIDVVVHPESIVHSLVEFSDGATLAQLSPPDMRVPIQYAFSWPARLPATRKRLDLASVGALTFRAPDEERFPALRLVKDALCAGGARTAALSAADEIAVERFLAGDIGFGDIVRLVSDVTGKAPARDPDSVEEVFEIDRVARAQARNWRRGCAIFRSRQARPSRMR